MAAEDTFERHIERLSDLLDQPVDQQQRQDVRKELEILTVFHWDFQHLLDRVNQLGQHKMKILTYFFRECYRHMEMHFDARSRDELDLC